MVRSMNWEARQYQKPPFPRSVWGTLGRPLRLLIDGKSFAPPETYGKYSVTWCM